MTASLARCIGSIRKLFRHIFGPRLTDYLSDRNLQFFLLENWNFWRIQGT